MKNQKKKLTLWIAALSLVFGLALTQSGPGLLIDAYDVSAFPRVGLRLSAWDLEGLPITNLSPNDFVIRENNGAAITPDSLVIDQDAPLNVILVIDTSGSMQGQALVDAKAAAARFLDRLSPGDKAALIAFSDAVNPDPAILSPGREMTFSGNLAPIYDLVEGLTAQGGTHLYNALLKAVSMTGSLPSGHRAVLLLSDGVNEPANLGDPQAAISLAQENRLPIYVIGLGNLIDEPYLRRVASETGGVFKLAPRSSELAQTFDDMASLLKTQYALSYSSLAAKPGVRSINVNITLNTSAGSVSQDLVLSGLPDLPTATPELTATPTPLPPTPTPKPIEPTPVVIIMTPEPPTGLRALLARLPWYAWLGGIMVLGVFIFLIVLRVLRRSREVEKCANCGFELKNAQGPCPQCGDTRRIATKVGSK